MHDETSKVSLGLARLKIWAISCDATMQALKLVEPVITSFPEPNSRQVQCGFASLMVMAANRFRSYVVKGKRSASLCRLIVGCDVAICDVDTMLWHCGIGKPLVMPLSPPSRSPSLLRSVAELLLLLACWLFMS